MALNRLLIGIIALTLVCGNIAFAQLDPTESNQEGILIMDGFGRVYSADTTHTSGTYHFKELEASSQSLQFPFPVAKDIEFVADAEGKVKGAYVLDSFGGQFPLTLGSTPGVISSPAELNQFNPQSTLLPYFGFDAAKDIEIAPDWRDVTYGYKGYFILDADGVVHSVGKNNLPYYVFGENGQTEIKQTLYPNTIDISGMEKTAKEFLEEGPITDPINLPFAQEPHVGSPTAQFLYFGPGTDIARDLEISVEWTSVTVPASLAASGVEEKRTVALTNGYYVMDGLGPVHSNRLPLNFNVVDDTESGEVQVTYKDLMDPKFGLPINNAPLAAPWDDQKANTPFFGSDAAVDFELTPSGNGYYLLDSYGGIHAVGDAKLAFPPKLVDGSFVRTKSSTPYFGFPIAKDLSLVTNKKNESLGLPANRIPTGLLVIDGFGSVHAAGLANTYQVSQKGNNGSSVTLFSDDFVAVESTPKWVPGMPKLNNFVLGSELFNIKTAPNYRNVSAVPFVE
ncbi:hypothetical protein GF373_05335 [bacterium]|nr:hypothetical protein [bacterium]